MSLRLLLPMTVLAVLTAAVFSPNLRADNGVVTMSKAPYYYVTQGAKRQHPNPTYWTWMPCPLHGGCDTCWDHRCPGGKGFWTFPAVRWLWIRITTRSLRIMAGLRPTRQPFAETMSDTLSIIRRAGTVQPRVGKSNSIEATRSSDSRRIRLRWVITTSRSLSGSLGRR